MKMRKPLIFTVYRSFQKVMIKKWQYCCTLSESSVKSLKRFLESHQNDWPYSTDWGDPPGLSRGSSDGPPALTAKMPTQWRKKGPWMPGLRTAKSIRWVASGLNYYFCMTLLYGYKKSRFHGVFLFCGETGIRTPEGLASLTVFKTAAFNHSAISPYLKGF